MFPGPRSTLSRASSTTFWEFRFPPKRFFRLKNSTRGVHTQHSGDADHKKERTVQNTVHVLGVALKTFFHVSFRERQSFTTAFALIVNNTLMGHGWQSVSHAEFPTPLDLQILEQPRLPTLSLPHDVRQFGCIHSEISGTSSCSSENSGSSVFVVGLCTNDLPRVRCLVCFVALLQTYTRFGSSRFHPKHVKNLTSKPVDPMGNGWT